MRAVGVRRSAGRCGRRRRGGAETPQCRCCCCGRVQRRPRRTAQARTHRRDSGHQPIRIPRCHALCLCQPAKPLSTGTSTHALFVRSGVTVLDAFAPVWVDGPEWRGPCMAPIHDAAASPVLGDGQAGHQLGGSDSVAAVRGLLSPRRCPATQSPPEAALESLADCAAAEDHTERVDPASSHSKALTVGGVPGVVRSAAVC